MVPLAMQHSNTFHLPLLLVHLSRLSSTVWNAMTGPQVCLTLPHLNLLLKLSFQVTSSESFPHNHTVTETSADLNTSMHYGLVKDCLKQQSYPKKNYFRGRSNQGRSREK